MNPEPSSEQQVDPQMTGVDLSPQPQADVQGPADVADNPNAQAGGAPPSQETVAQDAQAGQEAEPTLDKEQMIKDLAASVGYRVEDVDEDFLNQLREADIEVVKIATEKTQEKGKEKAQQVVEKLAQEGADDQETAKPAPLEEEQLLSTLNVAELYDLAWAMRSEVALGDQSAEQDPDSPEAASSKDIFISEVAKLVNQEASELIGAEYDGGAFQKVFDNVKSQSPNLSDEKISLMALKVFRDFKSVKEAALVEGDGVGDDGADEDPADSQEEGQVKRLDKLKSRMMTTLVAAGGIAADFVQWNVEESDLTALIDALFSNSTRAWGGGSDGGNWVVEGEGVKSYDKYALIEAASDQPDRMSRAIFEAATSGDQNLTDGGFSFDFQLLGKLQNNPGPGSLREAFNHAYTKMFMEGSQEEKTKRQKLWQRLVAVKYYGNEKAIYDKTVMKYFDDQPRIESERWQEIGWTKSQQPATKAV